MGQCPRKGLRRCWEVLEPKVKVDQFQISDDGTQRNLTQRTLRARTYSRMLAMRRNPNTSSVKWLKTVPLSQAIKEKGFFGNQNTVCKPMARKWNNTVERLKVRFGVK